MNEKMNVGVIGLGVRGKQMLKYIIARNPDISVLAVCDLYEDRIAEGVKIVAEAGGKTPYGCKEYKDILAMKGVAAVFIFAEWSEHVRIAIDAMEAGIAVAMEVGGAYSVNECWKLVECYEKTKVPFMMLENCCFDKNELTVTNMVRQGVFGKIVHCSGAYGHDLRQEVADGEKNRHYRLKNYLNRNCENYPTHELGPIAKILNINRGNRIVSLVTVASKSEGMREFIEKNRKEMAVTDPIFRQGDIVITLLTCAHGETIMLKLDTTLPRRYDREFTVRGTKGNYSQTMQSVFLDGDNEWAKATDVVGNFSNFDDYIPSIWKNITPEQKKTGHGGMDGITVTQFIDALKSGREMPVDVYDAASWMCISALSEQSIAMGGHPVAVPDFTNGKWILREPRDVMELD